MSSRSGERLPRAISPAIGQEFVELSSLLRLRKTNPEDSPPVSNPPIREEHLEFAPVDGHVVQREPARRRSMPSWFRLSLLRFLTGMLSLTVSAGLARAAGPATTVLFERSVLPILTAHCLKCHGLEAKKAGLDLRTV